MKKILLTTAAIGVGATAAVAGGVERSNQSVGVLFEEGRYLEFGLSQVNPKVSGDGDFPVAPGVEVNLGSGDMTENYSTLSAAYKADLSDTLSYALIFNQPYGADVAYPLVSYPFAGSTAVLDSNALTGLLKYTMPNNVSVYGGLRAQWLDADAQVNLPNTPSADDPRTTIPYTGSTSEDVELGYVVGAAYERPEIALRVSLTYNSAIDYSLDTVETGFIPGVETNSSTDITTPQSLHLEFQSGIAADTLLFGGVRWVEWTEFEIAPQAYSSDAAVGRPLVSYEDDRITYTLGLGRRLSEQWALAGSLSYEETTGSKTGNLGPTDGFLGASLAAIYNVDNVEITTGISYVEIGDATTNVDAEFTDNSAIGFGMKVGYSF